MPSAGRSCVARPLRDGRSAKLRGKVAVVLEQLVDGDDASICSADRQDAGI